jgi:hypothetical protein
VPIEVVIRITKVVVRVAIHNLQGYDSHLMISELAGKNKREACKNTKDLVCVRLV